MDISGDEARTKWFMTQACDEVYGLFDAGKVDGFGLHSFVATESIAGLFTDSAVSQDFVTEWKRLGVPVTTVVAGSPDLDIPLKP